MPTRVQAIVWFVAGLVMMAGTAISRYFRGEEARWRKVIHDAGIRAE